VKLSTKTYYGLRAIICLAEEEKPCSVREISAKEKIPRKYLEKIFQELRSDGFLISHKGSSGGYSLARPSTKIKAGDIIMALEKEAFLTKCQTSCPMAGQCTAKTFWKEMQQSFESSFRKTTLANLISKSPEKGRNKVRNKHYGREDTSQLAAGSFISKKHVKK